MKIKLRLILNLLLMFCLVACGDRTDTVSLLKKAEGYMTENPKYALSLLEDMPYLEDLPKEQNALRCLLITQAQDKSFIEHTSDSLINIAVHYYDKSSDVDRRAQAYYCKGRVFMDMMLFKEAMECFLKAEDFVLQTTNYNLQARIYNQLGDLSRKNALHNESLAYYQKSHAAYHLEDYQLGIANTLRDIGIAYEHLGVLDSSVSYFNQSLTLAEENGWVGLTGSVFDCLGNIYESLGEYRVAIDYLYKSIELGQDSSKLYSSYYSLGYLYKKNGNQDSAFYYLNKAMDSPELYILCQSYREYSLLLYQKKEYEAAFSNNERYILLRDSIEHRYQPEELTKIKALYQYQKLANERNQLELEKKEGELLYLIIVIILLIFIFLGWYLYQKRLMDKQLEVIRKDQEIQRYKKQVTQNQSEIKKYETFLTVKEKELQQKKKDLEEIEETKQMLMREKQNSEELLAERSKKLNEEIVFLQSELKQQQSLYDAKLSNSQSEIQQHIESLTQKEVELQLKKKELEDNTKELELVAVEKQRMENDFSAEIRSKANKISLLQNEIDEMSLVVKEANLRVKKLVLNYLVSSSEQMRKLFDKKEVLTEYTDQEWQTFEKQLNQVYPEFITKLRKRCPNMLNNEFKSCCLFLLGIKTSRIAIVLNLERDTITKYRKKLREKYFKSEEEKSLDEILDNLASNPFFL